MVAHTTVLLSEATQALVPQDGGTYLDVTCGLGGHSQALLEASGPTGRVLSVDRDPEALRRAGERLLPFGRRSMRVQGHFSRLEAFVTQFDCFPADGLIADLGVSSLQLDDAERGFSFMREGPLDMRMGPEVGATALEFLHEIDEKSLAQVLRDYGEERRAGHVARAIIRARDSGILTSTRALATVIEDSLGGRRGATIHPATRAFQALRIAVNRELDELRELLKILPRLIRPGGRVAIISFHSLEDRIVKRAFAQPEPPKYPRGLPIEPEKPLGLWKALTKKPMTPSEQESTANPRARSAKLRVAERRV